MNGKIKRVFGIKEGVSDPGAAEEAIGELSDIVDQYFSDGAGFNLGRELTGWFKANLQAITAALGFDDAREGGDELRDSIEPGLAREGGPGSGRKPADPTMPPGAEDEVYPSEPPDMPPMGDDPIAGVDAGDPLDEPPPPASGPQLPSQVMKTLRDIIQQLEDLAPDEDPAGDEPAPPPKPKAKKDKPEKKSEKKGKKKDEESDEEVEESLDDGGAGRDFRWGKGTGANEARRPRSPRR